MDAPDDVLEQGPRRPRRGMPALVAAVCLVALAVLAFIRFGDSDDEPAPADTARRTAAPPLATPWPSARGACGHDVELPLVSSTRLRETTGLRVVTGGARLARADVDAGSTQTRADLTADGLRFQQLVRHGDVVYALAASCDQEKLSVLRDTGRSVEQVEFSGPVDALVGGAAGVWGVDLPEDGEGSVVLRGVTGRDVRLPVRITPHAVAGNGVVGVGPDRTMYLLNPSTGKVVRKLGQGDVQAAGRHTLLWTGQDCRFVPGEDTTPVPKRPCALHGTALTGDKSTTTYQLPDNRTPASDPVVSPDDRYVAFQLSRPRHELHFADRHPWTPSQVAVLDLETKRLRVVPGLQLAAKTTAGLAFSADGRWLAVTTNEGSVGVLYVWQLGAKRLYRSTAPLPGPLVGAVPVLVTG